MNRQEEIDRLRQRVADARSDCEAWRKSGPEDRYHEAYVNAKALELELDEKLFQPVRRRPA